MSIAARNEPRIVAIEIDDDVIKAELADGRTVTVPLTWSWRLCEATPSQRRNFEILGDGESVHWPEVDEDLSARGMLEGIPARRPSPSATRSEG